MNTHLLPKNMPLIGSLLVAVLIIITGIVLSQFDFSTPEDPEGTVAVVERRAFTTTDTDGDGLLDWEEDLWGTDQNNPDTDGDGTPDGEEIASERDPLVPGPDDELSRTVAPTNTEAPEEEGEGGPKTLTQQFSQELLSRYLLFKQSGVELTDANIEKMLQPLLDDIPSTTEPTWVRADIQTTTTTDGSIRTYANQAGALIEVAIEELRTVANITQKPLSSLTAQEQAAISAGLAVAAEETQKLTEVAVPEELVVAHLNILNGLFGMTTSLQTVVYATTDPLGALGALQQYGEHVVVFGEGFTTMKNTLQSRNMLFTPDDGGSVFTSTL